jgi:hypothetical protein
VEALMDLIEYLANFWHRWFDPETRGDDEEDYA